jgi:hypothetical protein
VQYDIHKTFIVFLKLVQKQASSQLKLKLFHQKHQVENRQKIPNSLGLHGEIFFFLVSGCKTRFRV